MYTAWVCHQNKATPAFTQTGYMADPVTIEKTGSEFTHDVGMANLFDTADEALEEAKGCDPGWRLISCTIMFAGLRQK